MNLPTQESRPEIINEIMFYLEGKVVTQTNTWACCRLLQKDYQRLKEAENWTNIDEIQHKYDNQRKSVRIPNFNQGTKSSSGWII